MWEAERDVFTFQVQQPLMDNKSPTKRNVLCAIASLFAPHQFLAPFTVRANILMQEIWIAGIDWDDELPENLKAKWEKRVSELPQLSKVAIPRCLRRPNPVDIELHLFWDASNDAFASVAYLVCRYQESRPSSCLIAWKCLVSPVKAMTIPRLELIGAVLSTRLARNILKVITVDRTTFWSDSENVWYWPWFAIKAASSNHLLPTELAKFSELQVLSSGDTCQERQSQQTCQQEGFLL